MTTKRDIENQIEYAREKGLEQGIEQGLEAGYKKGREDEARESRLEIARKLKSLEIPVNAIQEATGLSEEEITRL